jgi:hypothetical protein
MHDDIRHPQFEKTNEDKNKELVTEGEATEQPAARFEAPDLYSQEDGFTTTPLPTKSKWKDWFKVSLKHGTRKQQIIGGSIVAVLILVGGTGVYAINRSNKKVAPNVATPVVEKVVEPPKSTTETSRLTGEQITPELNKRPVVSIQIENSPDARPQSGLKDAGVVFEAIAEGGITRFNASFLETQPDYIGPVRSVRPYYAVLAAPFDPIFVHAGGSAAGLAKLQELGLKDFDHGANGGAFKRVSDRYAPHNLYTSMAELDKASASRGYTSSNVKSLPRKAVAQPNPTVTARTVDLSISSPLYNVHYDYDQASNSYKRMLAGKPHTDQRSGAQLAPKVVVALVMQYSQNGIYSVYQTTGSGSMVVFQDGVVQKGKWSKTGEREQFTFTDEAGKPLELSPGQTWISLVKADNAITYNP